MTFTRDLGVFNSKAAVWEAFPSGGTSGDYVQIDGKIYGWSTASSDWVLALAGNTHTNSQTARASKRVVGDMDVYNNLHVGGVLSAKVIRGRNAFCGLFADSAALNSHCANPLVGQWALTMIENRTADNHNLGEVWVCEADGTWIDAGFELDWAEMIEQLEAEIDAREAGDNDLQNQIDQEIADRQDQDASLQANIDAEAETREAADSTLDGKITAEAETREAADSTLDGKITAEAETREAADSTLDGKITTLGDSVAREIEARETADNTFAHQLEQERDARKHGDEDWLDQDVDWTEEQREQARKNLGMTLDYIPEKSVGERELKEQSVTNEILGDRSISSNKIGEREVKAEHIGLEEIKSAHIEEGAVLPGKLDPELLNLIYSAASHGIAVANEFGDNPLISVSQKKLTDAFVKVWQKLEDMTGESLQGINMSVTPDYFIGEDGADIHITANTVEANGIFEQIRFLINGAEVYSAENVDILEYDTHIDETSVIKCEAKIMGVWYERQNIITHYNSFWLGAGTAYTDIMDVEHCIPITNGMRGAYDVDVAAGDHLFIVVGGSLAQGFIRADMNSIEIPFTESTVEIEGETYKVYTSVNTYNAGTYNIDING